MGKQICPSIQNSTLSSPIPSAIIMNSIAQITARSARLNGASALRQANPIARRAFTNGPSTSMSRFQAPAKNSGLLMSRTMLRNTCQNLTRNQTRAAAGLIGAGTGIGTVFGSLITGVARNPSMRGQLFSYAILGFAFAEATGLFALMVSFLILFAM